MNKYIVYECFNMYMYSSRQFNKRKRGNRKQYGVDTPVKRVIPENYQKYQIQKDKKKESDKSNNLQPGGSSPVSTSTP